MRETEEIYQEMTEEEKQAFDHSLDLNDKDGAGEVLAGHEAAVKGGREMERMTTNKEVSEMSMIELAYNSCYAKDGKARYRDHDADIDARQLTMQLLDKLADIPNEFTCDDDFDDFMLECLQYGTNSILGLIAVFYRNVWAMADLRERLKEYEDLEEQGKLLKLPCNAGDTVYAGGGMSGKWIPCSERMPLVPEGTSDEECPEFIVMINGMDEPTALKCDPDGTWFDDFGEIYDVSAWQFFPEPYRGQGCIGTNTTDQGYYGGGWIDCRDKLPEDGIDVLVWFEYFRYGEYNRLFQTAGISYTYEGKWSGFVNGESGWNQLSIIAWQPLPQPYQDRYREGDQMGNEEKRNTYQ